MKVPRAAGVLWVSSVGPVVILLLLERCAVNKDVNMVVMKCYLKRKSVKIRMECQLEDTGKGCFEGGRK